MGGICTMANKRIGIIGAMAAEVEGLHERMTVAREVKKAGLTFFEGTLGATEIVLVQSGIGKVNAAACAQILADCFEVTHILNTGIAGSLDDAIDIGDIVVSTDALQHDMTQRRSVMKPDRCRDSLSWHFQQMKHSAPWRWKRSVRQHRM